LGSVTAVPGRGKGVAQDWPILAHAPRAALPVALGSRTISVCDLGDAVCDYDPNAPSVSPAAVAIHTSYALNPSGGYPWTGPVYQLLGPAQTTPAQTTPAQTTPPQTTPGQPTPSPTTPGQPTPPQPPQAPLTVLSAQR
jgi:hypothetical protein